MVYLVSVQYEVKQEAEDPATAVEKALDAILDEKAETEYVSVWPQRPEKKEGE